ncbi:MAG: MBL fold metallo-hydrolase [Clostridia bacterium]|nr:MBL fold metallo-hydrolase [Clostridia bacterium]
MKLLQLKNSLFGENTYFVVSDNGDCLIIDPGSDYDELLSVIMRNKLNVLGILITHGHYDHIWSCKSLQDLGYKVYISSQDADKCNDNKLNLSNLDGYKIDLFEPDFVITDEQDNLVIGDFNISVLHVPGHSKGGLAFIIDNYVFTGDTLFEHGYGRYDFYDGDYNELMRSLRLLLKYKNDGYIVKAGH